MLTTHEKVTAFKHYDSTALYATSAYQFRQLDLFITLHSSRKIESCFEEIMEWRYSIHRRLDLEEALNQLRKEETSTIDETDRTEKVRVASVTQAEDELSCGRLTVRETKWRYWGMYDDHS